MNLSLALTVLQAAGKLKRITRLQIANCQLPIVRLRNKQLKIGHRQLGAVAHSAEAATGAVRRQ